MTVPRSVRPGYGRKAPVDPPWTWLLTLHREPDGGTQLSWRVPVR